MSKYMDFDAAFAEAEEARNPEPITVKLFGRDWELPGSLPAAPVLKVARWMADGREQESLTTAELFDLAGDLVPKPIMQQWTDRGLTVEQLAPVVMWLLQQYQGTAPGVTEGKASTETGLASGSSSGTGPSSSATSDENTDWSYPRASGS